MFNKIVFLCLQAFLVKESFSYAINNCNNRPSAIPGNIVTTVTALPTPNNPNCGVQTSQNTPIVTEILPSLQLGDISVGGDIPVGGTIKVSGCFPVYGLVSVDGTMPSSGTAVINTGGSLMTQVEPACRY